MPAPQRPSGVIVQPNSTGQDIETVLVTQVSTGLVVGRQVLALADPNNAANMATITTNGELLTFSQTENDALATVILELRIIAFCLIQGFQLKEKLAALEATGDFAATYVASPLSPR